MRSLVLHYRRLAQWTSGWRSRAITGQLTWVVLPFAAQQVIRLATQIALARLLAPEMFGLMLLVNTLRTGAELLSDIGIGQSVVRSRNGDRRDFLDVAWTLQVIRGGCLSLIMLGASWPVSKIYGEPDLLPIMLAVSPIFLISGLLSPSLFVMQRHLMVRARAAYDMTSLVFQCVFTIALAMVMPNVWALVVGLMASTLFTTAISFFFPGGGRVRFAWHGSFVGEIFHFGKWIFLSTAIYFAATSADRIFFVGALPLALAGVFGVSRTFADMLGSLAQRAGSYLVFPRVAALRNRVEAAPALRSLRRRTLVLVAVATGLGMAIADQFILLAYDGRYHAAAFMIPWLLFGVWFSILSSFAEAMLMGAGRPAPSAWANAGKFVVLVIGLPLAMVHAGLLEALFVLVAAEAVRWLILVPPSHSEGFAGIEDDLMLTTLVLGTALLTKTAVGLTGIAPSPAEWWSMRALLHA